MNTVDPTPFIQPFAVSTSATAVSTSATAVARPTTADIKNWIKQSVTEHPVLVDLPPEYLAKIGEIVSHWALLEWLLNGTICTLLGVGRKEARITFGTANARDFPQVVKQHCAIKQIPVPKALPTRNQLENAEKVRDLVGHCIWLKEKHTGQICAQDIRGSWTKDDPAFSRRMYPYAQPVDLDWLNKRVGMMRILMASVQATDQEIQLALKTA